MTSKIDLNDIHDKNINYLIGAGASYGLFPTLGLKIKNENENENETIETLATYFDETGDRRLKDLLFMYYYESCIKPISTTDFNSLKLKESKEVINNYKKLMQLSIEILRKKRSHEKKINFFTTNYDACITHSADILFEEKSLRFNINDGTRGFHKRTLEARNYNCMSVETGIFSKNKEIQPQINIIHLHGSVYWRKDNDSIIVDYNLNKSKNLVTAIEKVHFDDFKKILEDEKTTRYSFSNFEIKEEYRNEFDNNSYAFWEQYNKLPIVNPTKWKFYETVFEEHYYQMLRHLSYELEKPHSILITFGFSFADEHIRNLIKRSLYNPSLKIYICCFNVDEKKHLKAYFSDFNNIEYITTEDGSNLDFTYLNSHILSLEDNNNVELYLDKEEK